MMTQLQRTNGRQLARRHQPDRRPKLITLDGDGQPPSDYVTWREYALAQEKAARDYRQWAENWSAAAIMLAVCILFSIMFVIVLGAFVAPYLDALLVGG